MSCIPPVSGRVSAIKSQFENLSTFESLDINGCKAKQQNTTTATSTATVARFPFKRSATSFDIIRNSDKVKNVVKTWSKEDSLPKQASDSVLIGNRKAYRDSTSSRKLKEINDNTQVKLSRHTSDPVKRSSIKRSPAFRIGDKQNKTVLVKQTAIEPPEFDDEKVSNFLKRCVTDMEKLQQAGLTDSMKAALRQPLPTGPPPKKPPRCFLTAAQDDTQSCLTIIEEPSNSSADADDAKKQSDFESKKEFLENHIAMKRHLGSSRISPLQKSKPNLTSPSQATKLLNCMACHRDSTIIYDSVEVLPSTRPTTKESLPQCVVQNFRKSQNPSEHIYMEPYGHLGRNKKQNTDVDINSATNEDIQNATVNNNSPHVCSCPEGHSNSDSHYLCTPIDETALGENSSDKDEKLTIDKTYDEISILVNAAFQQKCSDAENCSIGSRDDDNSEARTSIKLCRSLTEKRKDYVRRVSVMPQKKMQQYGTLHQTFKSPVIKTFSFNVDNDTDSVEEIANHTGMNSIDRIGNGNKNLNNDSNIMTDNNIDINLTGITSDRILKYKKLINDNSNSDNIKFRPKKLVNVNRNKDEEYTPIPTVSEPTENDELNTHEKLFQVCLLVGYNSSSDSAYLKLKYPPNEPIPDNIEQLIFPSRSLIRSGQENQDYCLILTDDNGFKVYGYCRRILPENSEMFLPMAYCIISVTKAFGFYQKVLREIESRHGQADAQFSLLLNVLHTVPIPNAGKFLHVKIPVPVRPKTFFSSNHKISTKRLSLEANPKWLTESAAQAAFPDRGDNETLGKALKKSPAFKSFLHDSDDKKQSNPPFDLSLINRGLIPRDPKFDEILIRRPNDLRLENTEICDLLVQIGSDLLLRIFSSLLLERKVILQSGNISLLSRSILALQSVLYPFEWQYTIVTILPHSLIEICQAPFPVLAGIMEELPFDIEDGLVIDLDHKQIVQSCGDEQTIIPNSLQEGLKLSLEMVDLIDQGKMLSSVLISEAFLKFFIVLFANYRTDSPTFNKDHFIQAHSSQKIKLFLEWFVETSMFRHFCNRKYVDNTTENNDGFYDLFDARVMEKSEKKTKTSQNIETIVKNSKIINKKCKTFKDRFKEFINSSS